MQKFILFGLLGPIIALNIWVFSQLFRYFEHLISILIIAAIIAFLLNYPVRSLERIRLKRTQSIVIVLLLTVTVLIVLGVTVVPSVIEQTKDLFQQIPEWLQSSNDRLVIWEKWANSKKIPLDLNVLRNQINANLDSQVKILAGQAFGIALGTVSGLFDLLLVMVLAFYMLLYGDSLWMGIMEFIPDEISDPLTASLRINFQNFFISQLLLGAFMATTLTAIFILLGVPFALSFGILIGISELIPFIGATLGIGLVTLLVMLKNFGLALSVGISSIVMQQIKDNLIAPKLMGNFIGLNPIMIFVSILIGGQIAGLLGIVISVPIAGTIKGAIDLFREHQKTQQILSDNE
jgi:predicted PurR-regulated permease PerM